MHKRFGLALFRLVMGATVATAIVTQYMQGATRATFNPVNFFSYFTIESNILAAFIFIVTGAALMTGIKLRRRSLIRGAAVLYMTITGIVYAILLSGIDADLGLTMPWVNMVLHYLMPVAVLIDWFADPPEQKVPFKSALIWTIFPALYLFYSLIRGYGTGWYPYPFLNPEHSGYGGIITISIGILVVSIGLIWVITKLSGRANSSPTPKNRLKSRTRRQK
ncbi:MAG TPA: Pr6Pr family membrane protein [Candidatus Saccharimonadales bacterium]